MTMDTQDPSKNRPACCRCNWWSFLNSVTGQCRRMPPAAHFDDGHYWPITGRADWCGEFKTTFAVSVETAGRSDEPANAVAQPTGKAQL